MSRKIVFLISYFQRLSRMFKTHILFFFINNYLQISYIIYFLQDWARCVIFLNIVTVKISFLTRTRFFLHPRSACVPSAFRPVAFNCLPVAFYFVSSASGRVQNRDRLTILEPRGAECGWNANGTRSCHERYFYCKFGHV